MTLYEKRQQLRGLKSAFNKLTHHLLDLRTRVQDLSEEIRQEELEIYLATVEGAVTYIPEGKSRTTSERTTSKRTTSGTPPSSKTLKKHLDYISTLSADDKTNLIIALRDAFPLGAAPQSGRIKIQ